MDVRSNLCIPPALPSSSGKAGKLPPRMYNIHAFILEKFGDLALKIPQEPSEIISQKTAQLLAAVEAAFPNHPEHLFSLLKENLEPEVLAEICGKALLKTSQNLEKNQFLLKAILSCYPDVGKFIIQLDTKNQMTFSLEGYELLLSIMRKRTRLAVECHICITESEWKASFEQFLLGPDKKVSWVIRNADPSDRMDATIHYFPIFAEKREGIIQIAITDSLGKEGFGHDYIRPLIDSLRKQKRAQIFISPIVRQNLSVGCPIFSLRDIIHLTKYPRAMKFLHDHSIKEKRPREPNIDVYEIGELPSPLMKYTHDLEKLRAYEERINAPALKEEDFPLVNMTLHEVQDLEPIPPVKIIASLEAKGHIRKDNSVEGGGKLYNLKVRDRYLKYCAMVVAVAMAYGHALKGL